MFVLVDAFAFCYCCNFVPASHPCQVGNRLTWADLAIFGLIDPEKKNNTEVLQSLEKVFSHTVVIIFSSADDDPSLLGQLVGQGG